MNQETELVLYWITISDYTEMAVKTIQNKGDLRQFVQNIMIVSPKYGLSNDLLYHALNEVDWEGLTIKLISDSLIAEWEV